MYKGGSWCDYCLVFVLNRNLHFHLPFRYSYAIMLVSICPSVLGSISIQAVTCTVGLLNQQSVHQQMNENLSAHQSHNSSATVMFLDFCKTSFLVAIIAGRMLFSQYPFNNFKPEIVKKETVCFGFLTLLSFVKILQQLYKFLIIVFL